MAVAIKPPATLVMMMVPVHMALMRESRRHRERGEQEPKPNGKADQESLHGFPPFKA
jgi:hypothetical protein